jgi:polyhydroxybutyrate depolymerase
MKNIFTSLFILFPFLFFAQLTSHSWNFNGQNREYLMYVPAIYDGSTPVPVVFCLHGLGDNMNNFAGIGMNFVADTANFIVITPQALNAPLAGTAWNSGAGLNGFVLNATVDDVGFLGTILDTLEANFNINNKRVYACGFSMGGFMSNRLACEMNDRIAAVASVAGTIGNTLTCSPGRAVPTCHFHGTGDATVGYSNNDYGMDAEDMTLFWATNNNCNLTPTVTNLPDIAADGYTVTHSLYSNGDFNTEVELYRIDSADHIWMGPSNDIFYTTEIWKFFNKHTHYQNVSIDSKVTEIEINIFPNPTSGIVNIETTDFKITNLKIYNILGKEVVSEIQFSNYKNLDLSLLPYGTYFIQISDDKENLVSKKIIIAKGN